VSEDTRRSPILIEHQSNPRTVQTFEGGQRPPHPNSIAAMRRAIEAVPREPEVLGQPRRGADLRLEPVEWLRGRRFGRFLG
jgi:hypothetical protein